MSKKLSVKDTLKKGNEQKPIESQASSKAFYGIKDYLIIAGLLLLTLMAFYQTKTYDFVNWDDDRNIYENKHITTLNKDNFWKNSKEIFKSKVIGNYNPLTIWSFALEHKWRSKSKKGFYDGMKYPGNWHMTNLFLHMIAVLFSFLISRKLGLSTIAAGFVAALFAFHPMRVESVAWLTERKDVLFGAFYMWAIYLYIKQKEKQTVLRTIGIYLLFILSLFSKIQAVSLPLSLIAIDYFFDKKITLKHILDKWLFLLLSLGFGIYGLTALDAEGSLDTNANTYAGWQRIFVGSYSFMIYLVKWILPYRLSPLYPYEPQLPSEFYPTLLMLPATLYVLWTSYKKEWKNLFFGLSFFIVNIIFLLQILGAGQGFLADRFTYIAYFGLFFGSGYLLDKYLLNPKWKFAAAGLAVIALVAYFLMTISQVGIWKNGATLWTHVLKYYDKTTLPFGNRANYYRNNKMYKEAIADFNSAINLKSEPQTHNSRARLYFDTAGNDTTILRKALSDYNKAIELSPKDGEFWINRGATYARLGDIYKAIENINQGLIYKPDHETGYLNRFVLNITLSESAPANSKEKVDYAIKALADMDTYQKYKPYEANTWYEKARIKRALGRIGEARADIDKALSFEPANKLFIQESNNIKAAGQ